MADLAPDPARSIRRRSMGYWAAIAVLAIFLSCAGALYLATWLADLI